MAGGIADDRAPSGDRWDLRRRGIGASGGGALGATDAGAPRTGAQRYLRRMAAIRSIGAATCLLLTAHAAIATAEPVVAGAARTRQGPQPGAPPSPAPPVYRSHELWATVNVCSPKDAPGVVGVRGSMPGTGVQGEVMYMRFRLQYMDPTAGTWQFVGQGADSGFLPVGAATSTRQYGRSFTLKAPATAVTIRGLVDFQWRAGGRVTYAAQRFTSPAHRSLAGASPPDFSAATCALS